MPRIFYKPEFSIVDWKAATGRITEHWRAIFDRLIGTINDLSDEVSDIGIHRFTYTELNALGLTADDAGYLSFETTTGHKLRWTGTAWEFAPGDVGNGFFEDRAFAPQDASYWALCNGGATTYLALGATLSLTAFTTPDHVGTSSYRKSAAAYSGTITSTTGHTHGVTGDTGPGDGTEIQVDSNLDGATETVFSNQPPVEFHTHPVAITSGGPSAEPDPPHTSVLVYFRR